MIQTNPPRVGDMAPVQLPDELLRGTIAEVSADESEVVIVLDLQAPMMTKSHDFKRGDRARCRRSMAMLAGIRWEALNKV